jgi:hypothetical protein
MKTTRRWPLSPLARVDLRKDKPYQLDDKLEQLFLEKSMTGRRLQPPVRRDHGSNCASRSTARSCRSSDAQHAAGPATPKSARGAMALAKTFKDNLRTFTLITNTLAKDKEISDRWRGFEDIADSAPSGQPRRARSGRCAGRRREGRLSAPVAPLLQDEGEVARHGQMDSGTATRRCRKPPTR